MRTLSFIAIIAIVLSMLSCNPNYNSKQNVVADEKTAPNQEVRVDDVNNDFNGGFLADSIRQESPQKDKQPQKQQPAANPDWDKKIIKTASMNLEVADYNKYYSSIREKVRSLGGYVAEEQQSQSGYKIENSMTIKVPVDQFDNAVSQFSDGVQKVNERKITSQDVTTEVVDTRSRMEAKKHVRDRYLALLGQAKNMKEILDVQSEINGIQEQIESAAGRIEYLGHASVFSTINLTYFQVLNAAANETGPLEEPSFGQKISSAFRGGWQLVTDLFVALVTIWPLLLSILFAVFIFKKIRTQRPRPVQ
jgi:hypothetical protein